MSHSVRQHLRLEIDAYDESIRRWIPGYDVMLRTAAAAVAAVEPSHVVDLGAGTGGLAAALLDHAGIGQVELLDVDPEMLAKARRRLAAHGDRVLLTEASFDDELPESDAYAASLSLHHVQTVEVKRSLYSRIFAALRPGGVFANADATMPSDPTAADQVYRTWADHMIRKGIAEDTAWEHFAAWAEEDHYLPFAAEMDALAGAGFAVECVWREAHMTVLVGRKPA